MVISMKMVDRLASSQYTLSRSLEEQAAAHDEDFFDSLLDRIATEFSKMVFGLPNYVSAHDLEVRNRVINKRRVYDVFWRPTNVVRLPNGERYTLAAGSNTIEITQFNGLRKVLRKVGWDTAERCWVMDA